MNKKQGYQFAKENGLLPERGDFYRLFKSVCRLEDLTASEKIIFCIILSYTDRGLEFFMSNAKLALECGMEASNISKKITDLKGKGYIKTYKLYKLGSNTLTGRTIEPQLDFFNEQIEKNWNKFTYEEY